MSTQSYIPLRGRLITPATVVLALLSGIAGYFLVQRFMYGMGAVTNLNNGYAWGIWVVFDVIIGTGFACGGYAIAVLLYIFNKNQYHPLIRPAVLASLFGYALGGAAVIIDLGRWWNFWHLLWPGYAHVDSVMFEVGVCVTLYIIVLGLEFAPVLTERFGWKGLGKALNKVMFILIAIGILLPSMHQSSLGSMLIVMGEQVHPLYQTTLLPLLYLLSAFSMGFAVVLFEGTLSAAGFRLARETRILGQVATVLAWVIVAFLIVRFGDLVWRGELKTAFVPGKVSLMFWIETALFVLPVIIMLVPAFRQSARMVFLAGVAMLAAASLYRIDSFFVAYNPGNQFSYFPSIPEMMITLGIVAFEILAYIVFVRLLPIFESHGEAEDEVIGAAAD